MIIYISENLNSKKNGGSSTSGFEFLQFLRIKYKNVVVLTISDLQIKNKSKFYGHKLYDLYRIVYLKRSYIIKPLTFKKILKWFYYFISDIFKKNRINLDKFYSQKSSENIIYVNSWSGLFNDSKLMNSNKFKKVCIVRGSPESFIWQSFEENKNHAVKNAANYLTQFDKLIFVSSNGLKAWNKLFSKPIKSFYLPNSINEEDANNAISYEISEAKKEIGLSDANYNIIVVGSIQQRKAQDILLNVVEDLVKIIPNLKFHLVGGVSDTWGGDIIKRDILNSNFKDYFIFHGHSDKQMLFMRAGDLMLFTSRAEAFPRTVAEYMVMGKPIVAANVSGVNEMIENNNNGLLYNPFKTDELKSSIVKMYCSKKIQDKFSKNANRKYFTCFSKEKQTKNALKIFNQIDES